jgi:hypothetical protein
MDSRLVYQAASARMDEIGREAERRRQVREASDEGDHQGWSLIGRLRRSRPEPVAEPVPIPTEQPAPTPRVAA